MKIHTHIYIYIYIYAVWHHHHRCGGRRVVVSTAALHARVPGSFPGLGSLKETKMFLPHPLVKLSIAGSLRDREVACSASDLEGLNFESCVWRAVSSHSSHHPQEVLLAQFSLHVHKSDLKPDAFHFIFIYDIPKTSNSEISLYYTRHPVSVRFNQARSCVRSRGVIGVMMRYTMVHNAVLMLGHSVRRCSSIKPALFEYIVFSDYRCSVIQSILTQQTRDINPMMVQCWSTVCDAGPTLYLHWVNVPCLLLRYSKPQACRNTSTL